MASGDPLIRLDESTQRAQLLLAQQSLRAAEAARREVCVRRDRARRELERKRELAAEKILSADILDQLESVYQAARASCTAVGAEVEKARAQVSVVEVELEKMAIRAPFDGVIMKKFVEVGDTVQPGQPLMKYADVEYLQIVVDVPGRLRPGLNEGMMLNAELDVGDREVPVRIAQIFPMADAQRHTVTIKFDLPQGVSAPGMYAKVLVPDFNAPARSSPVIPNSAIRYNGSLPGVYVVGEEGKPMLRLIRVGEKLPGGEFSTVLSGLQAGERILRNPPMGISAGWTSSQGQ